MKLRSAPASPFARKIRMAAVVAGLADRITVVETNTRDPDAAFLRENPLGKIPALILDDGTCLYDSRVIAVYFDELAGGNILIPVGVARIPALCFEALADGIMDAIVLQVYERHWRAEGRREPCWLEHQAGKMDRGLTEAVRLCADTDWQAVHIGHIALASALGYLDLRFEGAWRVRHPGLVPWLEKFSRCIPAFEATRFQPPP